MGRSFVFNPLSSSFDLVDSGGLYWLDPVATFADLPGTDADGATRIVRGEDAAYTYDSGSSTWIFAGKIKTAAFGSTPNSNGYSVAANNTLTLQPADGTNPGGMSTTTQTFGGAKTFNTSASSPIFSTTTASPATAGTIRLANSDSVNWHNSTTGNIGISAGSILGFDSLVLNSALYSPGYPAVFTTGANDGAVLTGTFGAGIYYTDNPITVAGSNVTANSFVSSDSGQLHSYRSSMYSGDTIGFVNAFTKARGTKGSPTIVASGDNVGEIRALGFDGVDFANAASIQFQVDGTPGSNDMPGRIIFNTVPDGSQTLIEAFRLSNDKTAKFSGTVNLNTLTASQALALDSSKNIISNVITGSGNAVYSSAPTLTNPIVGTQSQGDSSTKAASTSYVDVAVANAIAGVNPAVAVQAATTSASDTSGFTYNNGVSGIGATLTGPTNTALTVDGYTFNALGQRLLVKNDTQSPSGAFNGVYYVTQVQALGLGLILTRALDFDTPSDMNNTGAIPVINGTVNTTTSWVLTSSVVTVGTTPLTFAEFSRNPADYLLKSSGDINETSFSAANNQSSVANVTGLAFANATVRSAKILLSVYVNATSSLYEAFELLAIQKGASWELSQTSVGDASGFVFTITNAGAIQYTNSNYSGFVSATVKFRSFTTSV